MKFKPKCITIEKLAIKYLLEKDSNHSLHNRIQYSDFYKFKFVLMNKCLEYNVKLRVLDRYYPSTKLCSRCGSKKYMSLSDRIYNCPNCGLSIDRDISEFINNGFRHSDDMVYNVKEFIYGEIETHKDINNKLHIDMSLYNPNEGKKTLDKLIPNIFKIVKPRSIFVRDTKSTRIVIIDCSYKGETERGIGFCIVYKNGKFDTLGEGPKEDYHE